MLLRVASQLAKVGVSAIALFLVLRHVDTDSMLRVLASADRSDVLAVIGIYLFGQAMTAWRWKIIARRVGFVEPMSKFLRFYFVGMFFNLFGPSTLGGDLVRALFLGASAGRRTVALHTVFFDRLSGLVTLVFVAVAAIALFGRFGLPWPIIALVSLAGGGMAVGWFLVPPLVRRFFARDGRANRLVERDLQPFWNDRALLARTAGVSVAFHVLQASSLILLGHALSMQVDWRYYFIFHPLVSVLGAIPVSVAGLGIREAGYVWFLQRQGVGGDTAIAFGILWFVVLLASSLIGGVVYLWSGAAIPTLRGHGGRSAAQSTGEDETQFPAAS
ncbi:MAG: lysylphosphatidylglycerol synthase transmembrane domain-containing protein [Candidatus Binatia bacterium]